MTQAMMRSFLFFAALIALSIGTEPALAQGAGSWQVAVQFSGGGGAAGSATSSQSTYTVTANGIPLAPNMGVVDLGSVPNGGTSPHLANLNLTTYGFAKNGSATANQSFLNAQLKFNLTWVPKNGDWIADPPPPTARIRMKRSVNRQMAALVGAVSGSARAISEVHLGDLHLTLQDIAIPRDLPAPGGIGYGDDDQDTDYTNEVVSINAQGQGSASVNMSWSTSVEAHAPESGGPGGGMNIPLPPPNGNQSEAHVQVGISTEFQIKGSAAPRGLFGGGNQQGSTDPSFTRWLPLSFSPEISSQPYRFAAGALPQPWGNIQCMYAISFKEEPLNAQGLPNPNFDQLFWPLVYQPIAVDGQGNPIGPYQVIGNTADFIPRYTITDADGNRLLYDQAFAPEQGIQSSLVVGTNIILTNAGPPGAIRERGDYTYTFQYTQVTPRIEARLISIADNLGNVQTLAYNGSTMTVTDSSSGRQLVFTGAPYYTTVDAPADGALPGTRTRLSWDGSGHMTQWSVEILGSGAVVKTDSYTYGGPNGDSITTITKDGVTASFTYTADVVKDPFDLAIPRLDAASYGSLYDTSSSDDGGVVRGTYTHSTGTTREGYGKYGVDARTNRVTDPRGSLWETIWSNSGGIFFGTFNRIKETGPAYTGGGANVWEAVFSPNVPTATAISITDPLGKVWSASLDGLGNVTLASNPLGQFTTYQYSPDGLRLNAFTDETGLTWQLGWGGNGNPASSLTSITDPANVVRAQINYNAFGQPVSLTIPAGVSASGVAEITTLAYSALRGDLTSITNPLGDKATINSYDALGDPLSFSVYPDTGDPLTSLTPLTALLNWNAAQQLISATLPNSASVQLTWNQGLVTQARAYAPQGGSPLSQMTFDYDTRGRLYRATDLVGLAAQYRYDRSDNLTKVLDGKGNTTVITYGPANEPTRITWPMGQFSTATYDSAGRLKTSTDERNNSFALTYDDAGRLTQFGGIASMTYDAAGRPLTLADTTGSTVYGYDPISKRLLSVQTVVNGITATVSYTYFPDGKVQTMASPAGLTTYTYDAVGRIASITSPQNETTTYAYDHAGRLLTETTATGQANFVTSYAWGISGQAGDPSTAPAYLRQITQTVNGNLLRQYTLKHSYLGQLQQRTGTGTGFAETTTYGYDSRGRLTSDSVSVTIGGVPYSHTGTHTYDLANNLQASYYGGWTYNANNQVTNAPPNGGMQGGTGLTYDASGNLLTLNGGSMVWDGQSQLAVVTSGGPPTSYGYNALGQRVSRTQSSATTVYVYDGDALIAELNPQGQVIASYTWGATGLISDRVGGASRFYLSDGTGNTRTLLSSSGAVLGNGVYSAWGKSVHSPGVPYAWSGGYGLRTDSETGLIYAGARYYTPVLGRFLSRDPLGLEPGPNPYLFGVGDPVNRVDATGLDFTIRGLDGKPWLVFDWEGTKRGLQTGGAVAVDTFTFGLISSKKYRNEPGYAASAFLAGLSRDAALTAATMGGAEAWHAARAEKEILQAVARAKAAMGAGKGARYGTKVHSALKKEIDNLGSRFIKAEKTYLNGEEWAYGTKGSVRVDVQVNRLFGKGPKRIYDLKTGSAKLTDARISQFRSHLPRGSKRIPVKELR